MHFSHSCWHLTVVLCSALGFFAFYLCVRFLHLFQYSTQTIALARSQRATNNCSLSMMIKNIHISVACILFYLPNINQCHRSDSFFSLLFSFVVVLPLLCLSGRLKSTWFTLQRVHRSAQLNVSFGHNPQQQQQQRSVYVVLSHVYTLLCMYRFLCLQLKWWKKPDGYIGRCVYAVRSVHLCWTRFIFYAHSAYKTNLMYSFIYGDTAHTFSQHRICGLLRILCALYLNYTCCNQSPVIKNNNNNNSKTFVDLQCGKKAKSKLKCIASVDSIHMWLLCCTTCKARYIVL